MIPVSDVPREFDRKVQATVSMYKERLRQVEMRFKFLDKYGHLPWKHTDRWGYDSYIIDVKSKHDVQKIAEVSYPDNEFYISGHPVFKCQYILYGLFEDKICISWYNEDGRIALRGLTKEFYKMLIPRLDLFQMKSNQHYPQGEIYLGNNASDLWSAIIPDHQIVEKIELDSYGKPLYVSPSTLSKQDEILEIERDYQCELSWHSEWLKKRLERGRE